MGEKKARFDQAAYIRQYVRQNITRVSVILSRKHDQDLIQHLEKKENKSDYIKQLIRRDISEGKAD